MSNMDHSRTGRDTTTTIQKVATAVAAVFLLVGILGFVPGITSDYDSLEVAGTKSHAHLLGIFEVSILHNLVHLAFGVIGLLMARTWSGARSFLIGGGVVYLVLWLYGLIIDLDSQANFVPLNDADNWLHLFLGLVMLGAGIALSRKRDDAADHGTSVR